jgi:hypothetical protein
MAGSNSRWAASGRSAPDEGAPRPAAALGGVASGRVVLIALSFKNALRSNDPGRGLMRLEFMFDMACSFLAAWDLQFMADFGFQCVGPSLAVLVVWVKRPQPSKKSIPGKTPKGPVPEEPGFRSGENGFAGLWDG